MERTPPHIASTIRRIRFAESGFSEEDTKAVWHQGEGFDLVTHVDREGNALEQEVALGPDLVSWTRASGVRTGRIELGAHEQGRPLHPRSGLVRFDPLGRGEVVDLALAICSAQVEDRYLAHLAEVLAAAIEGRDPLLAAVTTAQVRPVALLREEPGLLQRLLQRLTR